MADAGLLPRHPSELPHSLAKELLIPTRLYVQDVLSVHKQVRVKAAAHVTGGGLLLRAHKLCPPGLRLSIDPDSYVRPAIFSLLARLGGVSWEEMAKTFNMGIGFLLVMGPSDAETLSQVSCGDLRPSEKSSAVNAVWTWVMPAANRPRLAILGSGRGSNAVALLDAFRLGMLAADLVLVVSNVRAAPILDRAKERGVPTVCIPHAGVSRSSHESALSAVLSAHRVDHLLLAGYMRVLWAGLCARLCWTHTEHSPVAASGFSGAHAVADQWAAQVKVSGATVHFVDEGIDTGPILLAGSLVVRGDEGVDGLADRIRLEIEHELYPRAVQLFWIVCKTVDLFIKASSANRGLAAPHVLKRSDSMDQRSAARYALLSVFDKRGLVPLASALVSQGMTLLASGDGAASLSAGLSVIPVEEFTGAEEILEGA